MKLNKNKKKCNVKERKSSQNMRDIILLEKYKQIELEKLETIANIKNNSVIHYKKLNLNNNMNKSSINTKNNSVLHHLGKNHSYILKKPQNIRKRIK